MAVDLEATRGAYATIAAGDPETCGCLHCRNFIAARHLVYPPAILEFYNRLGIRADREAEIYEAGPAESDGHRYYGGWHHLIGRLVTTSDRDLTVAPGFNVVFSHARSCAEPVFMSAESVVQVEFFTRVPWLLEEPPT